MTSIQQSRYRTLERELEQEMQSFFHNSKHLFEGMITEEAGRDSSIFGDREEYWMGHQTFLFEPFKSNIS